MLCFGEPNVVCGALRQFLKWCVLVVVQIANDIGFIDGYMDSAIFITLDKVCKWQWEYNCNWTVTSMADCCFAVQTR